jgi:hypothetical protein
MLSQHYRAVSPEELRGVASLMNDWRRLVDGEQGGQGSVGEQN